MLPVVTSILSALFIAVSLALILVILVQRPQGGGLSGAFGGAGGGGTAQSAFGAKTGDVLTLVTVGVFVMFLLISMSLVLATEHRFRTGSVDQFTAPPPPTELALTALGPNTVELTWVDNSEIEDSYIVERSVSGFGGWMQIAELDPDTVKYTDTEAEASTNYFYRVSAYKEGFGKSDYIRDEVNTLADPNAGAGDTTTGDNAIVDPAAGEGADDEPTTEPAAGDGGDTNEGGTDPDGSAADGG